MTGRHVVGFRYPAAEGVRFLPGAFDSQLGQHIDVTFDLGAGPVHYAGTLHSAKVDEDGSGALLLVEVQDEP